MLTAKILRGVLNWIKAVEIGSDGPGRSKRSTAMKTKLSIFVLVVGSAFFVLGRVTADEQTKLHPKTMENLSTAMHGEAFAHAKYLLYAEHARKDGNTELADLLEKTAAVEHLQHLREEADLAGAVNSDQDNLKEAIKGETYEVETMYPGFAREARAAGDHAAADRFTEIAKDEANHRDAFRAALNKLETQHPHVPGN
jgi:rubrerythrin